jgi:hypothetical protein
LSAYHGKHPTITPDQIGTVARMTIPAFSAAEIVTAESTRAARLKWVIVVDSTAEAGRAANAVACVAATTAASVAGMIGPSGADADGTIHPGLPWAGCSILAADSGQIAVARAAAVADDEVFVVDMPLSAQNNRVYDDYLTELAGTAPDKLAVSVVSLVGPRKSVERITRKLHLL